MILYEVKKNNTAGKDGLFLEKTMKPIYNNYFRDILDYSLPHSTSPFISSPLLLKVLKTRV